MKLRVYLLLAVLAVFSTSPLIAIEIIEGPTCRATGVGQAAVTWTTDVPGDTRLDYGEDWILGTVYHDPNPGSTHSVPLDIPPGMVIYFQASSSDARETAQMLDWYASPDQLAEITIPLPDEHNSTGLSLHVSAGLNDVNVICDSAQFMAFSQLAGTQFNIGTDYDGTQWQINTIGPEIDGDGWSAYWNTSGLPQGQYVLMALMNTNIGQTVAQTTIYYDPDPPTPVLESPKFSEVVSGQVQITGAANSGAIHCDVKAKGPVLPVLNFGAEKGFKQTDFPVDGAGGTVACDPTAQASIFWAEQATRDEYMNDPRCAKETDKEACAKQWLVKDLAVKKKTNGGGTGSDDSRSGTKSMIKRLKYKWQFYPFRNVNVKKLKQKIGLWEPNVKGVLVHVAWPGRSLGHAMALKSIDDNAVTKNKKKVYNVVFIDPATGDELKVEMDEDGSFEYPTGSGKRVSIRGGGIYVNTGGGARSAAADDGWIEIGTDTNPADGISVNWNTTGLTPGLYWIRATGFDALGNAGFDEVEVAVAATPTNTAAAKLLADGTPVILDNKLVTGFFRDRFWIQEEDRSSGIGATATGDMLDPGSHVVVKGTMVTRGSERQINTIDVELVSLTLTSVTPVGMNNRTLGGGDLGISPWFQPGITGGAGLNNVGLYIKTWGAVVSTGSDPEHGRYLMISDGSFDYPPNPCIRAYTSTVASPGDYVALSGAAGLYTDTSRIGGAVYVYPGGAP